MKMKKILFAILISIVFMGVTIRDGMSQSTPGINVSLVMDKTGYLFDHAIPANSDPVRIAITLENVGVDDVITSDGFSGEDYHLFLTFVSQYGDVVLAGELLQVKIPPPVIINGVQVDRVETLSAGWILSATLPNAYAYYDLLKSGNWSVTAKISIRTYLASDVFQYNGVDYVPLEPALFEGVLESNTVNFSLVADEDVDGYSFPIAMAPPAVDTSYLADCDDRPNGEDGEAGTLDDGANINPGMVEFPGNGIDDDCNPATLDRKNLCNFGKPAVLTLVYTGMDCSNMNHLQDESLVSCSGVPEDQLPDRVYIVANDKQTWNHQQAHTWFSGFVNNYVNFLPSPPNLSNETVFDIDAANGGLANLRGSLIVHVFDGTSVPVDGDIPLQKVSFHASCSVPLFTGDQFGSLLVFDGIGEFE